MAGDTIDFDALSYEEKAKEMAEQKRQKEVDNLVAETREKFAKLGLDPAEIFAGKKPLKPGAPAFGNRS